MAKTRVLNQRFADRLHERAKGTITFEDFLQTIGDFVVIKDGRIDESHPDTKIAVEMFEFIKRR